MLPGATSCHKGSSLVTVLYPVEFSKVVPSKKRIPKRAGYCEGRPRSINGDKYVNPSTYLASTFITCPVTGRMDARRTARELSLEIGASKKSKLYINPLKVN